MGGARSLASRRVFTVIEFLNPLRFQCGFEAEANEHGRIALLPEDAFKSSAHGRQERLRARAEKFDRPGGVQHTGSLSACSSTASDSFKGDKAFSVAASSMRTTGEGSASRSRSAERSDGLRPTLRAVA